MLDGGAGNDLRVGYRGKDTLTGGSGFDVFSFVEIDQDDTSVSATYRQAPVIDFDHGQDKLEFGDSTYEVFFSADFDALTRTMTGW